VASADDDPNNKERNVMCGVFGFVARDEGPLNLKILERIAKVTERRGQHAWGMSWINRDGRLCMYKQTGRIRDSLGLLSMATDATVLIGHTRFATEGDPDNNLNNHPHPCDGGWIVHNGMIPDYREIIAEHDLHPVTECDSEVLGLLIEKSTEESMFRRCIAAANIASGPALVMLGLWKPGLLVAMRRGNPLHMGQTSRGFYLASLSEGLPGDVVEMENNKAFEFGEAA
jgi:glucosamine 6-phosphate synthetase-like amidotransferase/phosphosugar isomerase protein